MKGYIGNILEFSNSENLEFSNLGQLDFSSFFKIAEVNIKPVSEILGTSTQDVVLILKDAGFTVNYDIKTLNNSHLELLSQKYVEGLKAYFTKSLKRLSELSAEEFLDFTEFCERFKVGEKGGHITSTIQWHDLDVEAIKETFFELINSSQLSNFALLQLDSIRENIDLYVNIAKRNDFLRRISKHRFFKIKATLNRIYKADIVSIISFIILSCRYHIFTSEEENYELKPVVYASLK